MDKIGGAFATKSDAKFVQFMQVDCAVFGHHVMQLNGGSYGLVECVWIDFE